MLSLVVQPGTPDEQSFSLPPGRVTIGRTRDNEVFFLHKSLSRRHAQLDLDEEGVRLVLTDLGSKNGVFVEGRRVARCELGAGDSFRCGDVTFVVEGPVGRPAAAPAGIKTLPSPLAADALMSQRRSRAASPVIVEQDDRFQDKLFVLVRASELLVGGFELDPLLEALAGLTVQALEADRVAVLTRDEATLELRARVLKSVVADVTPAYSRRVVDWVLTLGSPASFADVAMDRTLPGDGVADAAIRAALCAPINAGAGAFGAVYADSTSRADAFRPDDLALLRAIANLAAVAVMADAARTRGT